MNKRMMILSQQKVVQALDFLDYSSDSDIVTLTNQCSYQDFVNAYEGLIMNLPHEHLYECFVIFQDEFRNESELLKQFDTIDLSERLIHHYLQLCNDPNPSQISENLLYNCTWALINLSMQRPFTDQHCSMMFVTREEYLNSTTVAFRKYDYRIHSVVGWLASNLMASVNMDQRFIFCQYLQNLFLNIDYLTMVLTECANQGDAREVLKILFRMIIDVISVNSRSYQFQIYFNLFIEYLGNTNNTNQTIVATLKFLTQTFQYFDVNLLASDCSYRYLLSKNTRIARAATDLLIKLVNNDISLVNFNGSIVFNSLANRSIDCELIEQQLLLLVKVNHKFTCEQSKDCIHLMQSIKFQQRFFKLMPILMEILLQNDVVQHLKLDQMAFLQFIDSVKLCMKQENIQYELYCYQNKILSKSSVPRDIVLKTFSCLIQFVVYFLEDLNYLAVISASNELIDAFLVFKYDVPEIEDILEFIGV